MRLEIVSPISGGGTLNVVPYIAQGGLKWQRNDIDAPDAGRAMDGFMYRDRVATKIRMDITCRPLTKSEVQLVLNAIAPEYVTVYYDDPQYGYTHKTMYSNNNPATFFFIDEKGQEWWTGVTFPLIEA